MIKYAQLCYCNDNHMAAQDYVFAADKLVTDRDGSGTQIFSQMYYAYEKNIASSIGTFISFFYTNKLVMDQVP